MGLTRRLLLKGAAASGALMAVAPGLLRPTQALANEPARPGFDAKDLGAALAAIGAESAGESPELTIKAPEIAENGAVVPIEVVSNIPDTRSITVLATKNPLPLCAVFHFEPEAAAEVSLRLRMAETSAIKAVAKTKDGKVYAVQKEVKVTVGGCGG